ncbi:hypothetical protein [Chryseobacterium sp.]|uniref:hypothetical protein n=1 Tax=Chryseobacterium sp. TaxID=1871047 RepID=UPI00321A1F52
MVNNRNYIVLLLLAIGTLGCSNTSNNTKEIKMGVKTETNQLMYELAIDARGCYFEVYINDVPVYFHYNVGATAFRLPVNSFIPKSGEQRISLKMFSVVEGKPFPSGAEVSLKIDEYPKGEARERKTKFSYKTPSLESKNSGNFADEKSFVANVPYELTDWSQGIDLSKEDHTVIMKELEKKYMEYTDAFKSADLSKYKELTKLRQDNIFTSMYYSKEQREQTESVYVSGIQNNKVRFFPLENYKVAFYGNGRLVGLQKKGDAPGVFIDNEDEKEAFMEYILFYRKNKNAPLEIVL